jgi:type I restriction enzyme S subunit
LAYIAEIQLGKMLQSAPASRSDVEVPYMRAGHLGELPDELPTMWASPLDLSRYRVNVGDLLVAEGGDVGRPEFAPKAAAGALIQNSLHRVRPRGEGDRRYLRYALLAVHGSDWLNVLCNRSTFGHLTVEKLSSLSVPVPSPRQQKEIAGFLDTETARIDALITKKRRTIKLIDLRVSATADRLALGLDHTDAINSRSEYFTVVPRHWTQTSLRHLGCEVQTGPFGSQLHAEEYVEGGWPVVNPANLKQGGIVPLPSMSVSDKKRNELRRHILRAGDIVFGRRGEMGRAGLVERDHAGWLCGTGSLRLRLFPRSPLQPAYLKLLLETTALRQYFELTSVGSTMDNLNSEILLGMPCLVPPEEEQRQVVGDVHTLRSSSERVVGRVVRQLELLQEHRQALITAAVTGELDVPGVAA